MKTATKIYLAIAGVIGLIAPQISPLISAWVAGHPKVALAVAAISLAVGLVHSPDAKS